MSVAAAWALLALAANGVAEQPSSGLGYGLALVKMVVALAVVCALAYVVLRYGVGRLFKASTTGRTISIVDRCPLSGGKVLWVVQAERRRFLLATADSSVSVVAELDADGDPGGASGVAASGSLSTVSSAGEDASGDAEPRHTGEGAS